MILEITIAVIIGILAGIFTGLTPGIHTNLIAVLLLSLSPFLLQITTPITLITFIIAMSVTHTFFNAIPAIYLGAPESGEDALSVLPGHRMLLQGKGYEALALTIIGGVFALIIGIMITPLIIKVIPVAYNYIQNYIGYVLLLASIFLIFRERKRLWPLVIFLLSGCFGLATLNLNIKDPLFPMLSSLFGIAGILISLNDKVKIPEQKITVPKIFTKETYKAMSSGTIVGTFTSMLPGLGPAEAAIIGAQLVKLKDSGFLILVGALDTLNMLMSFIALYTIEKARNGSVITISKLLPQMTLEKLIFFLIISLISGLISSYLCMKTAKKVSGYITKINYQKLSIVIILFIIIMTVFLSGFLGLLILFIGSFIGMLPPLLGIGRNHLMGCLLLPVILFFLF